MTRTRLYLRLALACGWLASLLLRLRLRAIRAGGRALGPGPAPGRPRVDLAALPRFGQVTPALTPEQVEALRRDADRALALRPLGRMPGGEA